MCFRNCERPNHILPLVCPSCFCCQYYKNIKHTRQPKYYGNSERSNRHSISRTSLKVLPMLQEPTWRTKHYGNCKNTHGEQSIMGTARTHTENKTKNHILPLVHHSCYFYCQLCPSIQSSLAAWCAWMALTSFVIQDLYHKANHLFKFMCIYDQMKW